MNEEALKQIKEKVAKTGETMLVSVEDQSTETVLNAVIHILSFLICSVTKDMKARSAFIDAIAMQLKETAKVDDFLFGEKNQNEKAH